MGVVHSQLESATLSGCELCGILRQVSVLVHEELKHVMFESSMDMYAETFIWISVPTPGLRGSVAEIILNKAGGEHKFHVALGSSKAIKNSSLPEGPSILAQDYKK